MAAVPSGPVAVGRATVSRTQSFPRRLPRRRFRLRRRSPWPDDPGNPTLELVNEYTVLDPSQARFTNETHKRGLKHAKTYTVE